MVSATYSPAIFDISSLAEAKRIILTEEGRSSDERWEKETPYFLDLIAPLGLEPDSLVLDYGCGIGRLAKGMIERFGCRVVGVDISQNMRTLANGYVASDRFLTCHPSMLDALGVKFDAAIAIWVLQHCFRPQDDLARIKSVLKPSGQLLIVNNFTRAVPTTDRAWVNDGVDVREMAGSQLTLAGKGQLTPDLVGPVLNKHAYWAKYENV